MVLGDYDEVPPAVTPPAAVLEEPPLVAAAAVADAPTPSVMADAGADAGGVLGNDQDDVGASLPATPPPPVADAPVVDPPTAPLPLSFSTEELAAPDDPPALTTCPICFDDVPAADMVGVARCSHRTCRPCLSRFWSEAILERATPFPRCVAVGCGAYASDADVAGVTGGDATRRLRHLRSIRPHRAADGRRLHCAADGCWEALPPPPPGAAEPVSECPRCGAATCGRCGAGAHPGRGCGRPLTCARQERLYAAWAVGRVGVCSYCGVHVERRGGCTSVRCRMCRRTFSFRPFGSAGEAAAAAVVPSGDGVGGGEGGGGGGGAPVRRSGAARVVAALAGVDEGGPPSWGRLGRTLGMCLVLMTWGAGMTGLPLWLLWEDGALDWELLPLAGVGFGMLLLAGAAGILACTRELPELVWPRRGGGGGGGGAPPHVDWAWAWGARGGSDGAALDRCPPWPCVRCVCRCGGAALAGLWRGLWRLWCAVGWSFCWWAAAACFPIDHGRRCILGDAWFGKMVQPVGSAMDSRGARGGLVCARACVYFVGGALLLCLRFAYCLNAVRALAPVGSVFFCLSFVPWSCARVLPMVPDWTSVQRCA